MVIRKFILFVSLCSLVSSSSIALGNLQVVIKGNGLISTEENPIKGNTSDLWCQASVNDEVQKIEWARFIRHQDRKMVQAVIDESENKARLVFGEAPVTAAGKYRCQIRTLEDGELVYGNMFAYTRPIIHTNSSFPVKMSDHDETLAVAAESSSFMEGQQAFIQCPIIGYPHPRIIWYKDGLPLEEDEDHVKIHKHHLEIISFEQSDVGSYRCVGTNEFPVVVDGAEQEFEMKLDQQVELSGNWGWMLPLIVILIIIILLFVIIYSCQAYKKYKADHYDVARQERNLRTTEECNLTENKEY